MSPFLSFLCGGGGGDCPTSSPAPAQHSRSANHGPSTAPSLLASFPLSFLSAKSVGPQGAVWACCHWECRQKIPELLTLLLFHPLFYSYLYVLHTNVYRHFMGVKWYFCVIWEDYAETDITNRKRGGKEGTADVFCRAPESKCFRLCGPKDLSKLLSSVVTA